MLADMSSKGGCFGSKAVDNLRANLPLYFEFKNLNLELKDNHRFLISVIADFKQVISAGVAIL